MAQGSYKSSGIKPGRISWAGGTAAGVGGSQISSWSFYNWNLISSSCPWGLLKASTKADVPIPATDTAGRLPASQLKSLFRATQKVFPNTSWDGTMQQTQQLASQSNSFFRANSATFLHWQPIHCSSNYHSWTSDHFTAAATTTPAPVVTSLQKQLPVLHQQLLVLHQRLPSCTGRHQRPLSCTSRYQQLTVLHQRSLSCISGYQCPLSCTSRHQQLPVLHQQPPSCTSRCQQLPVLNQRPLSCPSRYPQLPVLDQ